MLVVEQIGKYCASTAMIVCMHYAATAVIEAYGPRAIREAIASGTHVSTLAFSEAGSRSHFWAPISTAMLEGEQVRLDAGRVGLQVRDRQTVMSGRVVHFRQRE